MWIFRSCCNCRWKSHCGELAKPLLYCLAYCFLFFLSFSVSVFLFLFSFSFPTYRVIISNRHWILLQNESAFDQVFEQAMFKEYVFKLRVKMETYNVSNDLFLYFQSFNFNIRCNNNFIHFGKCTKNTNLFSHFVFRSPLYLLYK